MPSVDSRDRRSSCSPSSAARPGTGGGSLSGRYPSGSPCSRTTCSSSAARCEPAMRRTGDSTSSQFEGHILEGLARPPRVSRSGPARLFTRPALRGRRARSGDSTSALPLVGPCRAAYLLAMGKFAIWWGASRSDRACSQTHCRCSHSCSSPRLTLSPVERWLRWAFGLTLAWSVAVQMLGAAAWPPSDWFDGRDLFGRFDLVVTDEQRTRRDGAGARGSPATRQIRPDPRGRRSPLRSSQRGPPHSGTTSRPSRESTLDP